MKDARLLMVGREDGIVRGWVDHLRDAGANISVVPDGESAVRHLGMLEPEVVLADLKLGGGLDGFDMCRAIRARSNAVVVLAAERGSPYEEVVALAVGADHCVCQDVPVEVVVARVRSLLRRARGEVADGGATHNGSAMNGDGAVARNGTNGHVPAGRVGGGTVLAGTPRRAAPAVRSIGGLPGHLGMGVGMGVGDGAAERIVEGDLEIDLVAREVRVAGSLTMLTRIEFDLLVTLARQPRRVFTRDQLMASAWEEPFDGSHVLDTHLSRLRGKITEAGGERVAHAVRGVGYRLRG